MLFPLLLPALLQEDLAALEKQRCPKPSEFALVFSMGYGDDDLPRDNSAFETLLKKLKANHFNVVHCTHTPERLALCKKHGVKMMVHLLHNDHHVYKSPDKAKAVCAALRNDPNVWGYNIWNDPIRKTNEGRRRDILNVRRWDPTHPAYVGTYRTDGMRSVTNADVIGYYDFHWSRGPDQLFPHLLQYSRWAQERDAIFCRWLEVDAGQAGKGNVNRCLHSANTSIACGLKGILWFLGTSLIDRTSLEWTQLGHDIGKVNAEIAPLRKELMVLGNPQHIWSTPVTRTLNDKPRDRFGLPPGLENNAFPADTWLQPVSGEFVLGLFGDAAFVANHNAYAEQTVQLKLKRPTTVQLFDRQTEKWRELPVKDGVIAFKLTGGGGELLRFER